LGRAATPSGGCPPFDGSYRLLILGIAKCSTGWWLVVVETFVFFSLQGELKRA
jgi:hypothetical protein